MLKKLFYKYYRFYHKVIKMVALFLGVILAFYPTILSLQYCKVDKTNFELLKTKLSPQAIAFVEKAAKMKITSPKVFVNSIPKTFSDAEKSYILDIFQYSYDGKDFQLLILTVCFVLAIGFIVFRELTSAKKFAIAHSQVHLHKAVHHMRDNWTKIFNIKSDRVHYNKDVASECLTQSLDEVERFYSTVIGAPCRVCIKAWKDPKELDDPDVEDMKLLLKTFARSSNSKKPIKDTKDDTIEKNSEFLSIYEKSEPYCRYNNIDTITYYDNSHLDRKKDIKPSEQLGYKSTLTFAIRDKSDDTEQQESITIYGFLCVDTKTSGVFSSRWDLEPGYLLADFYSLFLKKVVAFT